MSNLDKISNIIKYKILESKINNIEIIKILYKSDDFFIDGFIFKNALQKKKLPVIILCRGGNNFEHRNMIMHPKKFFMFFQDLTQLILQNKIIVIVSNLRGPPTKELPSYIDEFGGNDLNDIINLYPIIKKYKYSDEKNIGVYGFSRGSIMAMLLHKKVNWIKYIIIMGGVTDILKELKHRPGYIKYLHTTGNLSKKDLKNRSSYFWIDKIPKNIPILILHGEKDSKVSVNQAFLFQNKLQKYNISHKIIIYKDADHVIFDKKRYQDVIDFILYKINK